MIFRDALGSIAPSLVFFFIFLFAITCFMGDVVIGENNLKFITESPYARYGMIALVLAVVFISCFWASDTVFAVLDILLALCGMINAFVIFRLFGRATEVYKDYTLSLTDRHRLSVILLCLFVRSAEIRLFCPLTQGQGWLVHPMGLDEM